MQKTKKWKEQQKCRNARQNTEIHEALEKEPDSTIRTRTRNSPQIFRRAPKKLKI
jgi:hypothetical protein